jgi:sortase A
MTDNTPSAATPAARRRWRLPLLPLAVAVVALLGVLVLLYPATADWFNQINHAQRIRSYSTDVKVMRGSDRAKALDEAHAYNAALNGGAAVEARQRIPVAVGAKLPSGYEYRKLLAADAYGLMGRIVIPTIGVDLPMYHGTSDAVLAQGVGHLEGSSLPVGDPGTHAVLAGHRGLSTATLFSNLNEVKKGDSFTIFVLGEVLDYRVTSIKVVDPDQTKTLNPVPGKDLVTLVTCTPVGINSQRILVTGERVLPTPAWAAATATAAPAGPGFPWWAAGIAGTLAALTLYVWASGRPTARRPRPQGPRGRRRYVNRSEPVSMET